MNVLTRMGLVPPVVSQSHSPRLLRGFRPLAARCDQRGRDFERLEPILIAAYINLSVVTTRCAIRTISRASASFSATHARSRGRGIGSDYILESRKERGYNATGTITNHV